MTSSNVMRYPPFIRGNNLTGPIDLLSQNITLSTACQELQDIKKYQKTSKILVLQLSTSDCTDHNR
jgi:hypothetical protein